VRNKIVSYAVSGSSGMLLAHQNFNFVVVYILD
jgi:hypothetical protein